jgi:hypothetical protein
LCFAVAFLRGYVRHPRLASIGLTTEVETVRSPVEL